MRLTRPFPLTVGEPIVANITIRLEGDEETGWTGYAKWQIRRGKTQEWVEVVISISPQGDFSSAWDGGQESTCAQHNYLKELALSMLPPK